MKTIPPEPSPATVLQDYWLLENRNYIEARTQSGFYASAGARGLSAEPKTSRPALFARKVDTGRLARAVATLGELATAQY